MLGANIIITLALLVGTSYVFCGMEFEVNYKESEEDMSLEGETFLNLTDTPLVHCFRRCFEDCRCMTFQMYKNAECQLLASTRLQKPTKFIPMNGYTYYEMKPSQQRSSCAGDVNCCTTSSPCLNGGTCQPTSTSVNNTKRFRCVCTPHYVGQRCQYPITSCRGYKNGTNKNGLYKIMDSNTTEIFTAYCDFDEDTNFAWTLVSSYSLRNKIYFRYKVLFIDLPINENHTSWTKYRLSKSKMESIQRDSTKWRMTCEFQKAGNITESDYVRVSMATTNPITFHSPKECVKVETIVVRGHRCSNCTAPLIQDNVYTLHFDCNPTSWGPCDFKPAGAFNCSEDNFGVYDCRNPAHRCSESDDSTTQIWFGGN